MSFRRSKKFFENKILKKIFWKREREREREGERERERGERYALVFNYTFFLNLQEDFVVVFFNNESPKKI